MRLLFLIIFFNASWLSAQQMVTLNGEISDAANGESLVGAVVYIKQVEGGAVTNVYGFYSLSVARALMMLNSDMLVLIRRI